MGKYKKNPKNEGHSRPAEGPGRPQGQEARSESPRVPGASEGSPGGRDHSPGPQTIQQARAAFALGRVEGFIKDHPSAEDRKRFKGYASALPAMIHMNGLGQTAAFCLSKKKEYQHLYGLLSEWLSGDGQPYAGKVLIKGITEADMNSYRLAQAEAVALLEWVKQFASAFIVDEENNRIKGEGAP